MELRQLRHFVVVAEEAHVGRAAARLHLTGPAVSQSIRALERSLGVRLFNRHPGGMDLTEAGVLLLERAVDLLAAVDSTVADVHARARSRLCSLTIAILDNGLAELTTPVLRAFQAAHPQVGLQVRGLSFCEHAHLGDLQYDVALVRPPLTDDRVAVVPLFVEPQVAMLPTDHPLAGAEELSCSDLLDEVFLDVSALDLELDRWAAYWRLDQLRSGEQARTAAHRVNSLGEVMELIALGLVVSTAAASTQRFYPHPGVRHVPLHDAPGSTAAVASPAGVRNPLVDIFIDTARRTTLDLVHLVPGARPLCDRVVPAAG